MTRKYTKADLSALSGNLAAKLPAPPKRKNEESRMQRALIGWWHTNCGHLGCHPWLLFSIPNGGGRSGPRVGAMLKAEGLRKGVPDLMLAVARGVYRPSVINGHAGQCINSHGLFLELKTAKGILSHEQIMMHKLLSEEGYQVVVIRSLFEGINEITTYLTK